MKIFAERLKYLRESRELTKKEVAAALGVSVSAYNRYETENWQGFPNKRLVAIAVFFNVTLEYLFGRSEI